MLPNSKGHVSFVNKECALLKSYAPTVCLHYDVKSRWNYEYSSSSCQTDSSSFKQLLLRIAIAIELHRRNYNLSALQTGFPAGNHLQSPPPAGPSTRRKPICFVLCNIPVASRFAFRKPGVAGTTVPQHASEYQKWRNREKCCLEAVAKRLLGLVQQLFSMKVTWQRVANVAAIAAASREKTHLRLKLTGLGRFGRCDEL